MIGRLSLAPFLFAALPMFAQEPSPTARVRREDVSKMVDAYLVSNLQERLALSDEQFVKLLPLVKRLQSDRRELAQRRLRILAEMHRLLERGSATEAGLVELMRELRDVEAAESTTIRTDLEAIDALLNPVQQAKYRVLEAKLEQRIRELMTHARQERLQSRPLREPLTKPQ